MKHGYGNVVQVGNALYFMALLSKNPVSVSLIQNLNRAVRLLTAQFEIKLVVLK